MDLAENALFKSYGVICLLLLRFTVPDELSMNRSDSDGFFLSRRLRKFSDSSGKTTDSSLFVEKQTLSFLACQLLARLSLYDLMTLACAARVHLRDVTLEAYVNIEY